MLICGNGYRLLNNIFISQIILTSLFTIFIISSEYRHYAITEKSSTQVSPDKKDNFDSEYRLITDNTVANTLKDKVRILCWILTGPNNHRTKAIHVKNTWGKRCNKLLFISSEYDEELPTVALNVSEGRDRLWAKTKGAFKYVYDNHRNDAEWFLKADDDTYVIMENLRFMLSSENYSEPIYFGGRIKKPDSNSANSQGYMSGGSGYVLSKKALDLFVEEGLPNEELCYKDDDGDEDYEMGECLFNVGVRAGESRDGMERCRFFPLPIYYNIFPENFKDNDWYEDWSFHELKLGPDCCSDVPISFHYTDPDMMYVLDYYFYRVRPYGINVHMEVPEISSVYDQIPSAATETTKIDTI